MKALSLTQPWATLVVTGRKTVETRGWRLPFFMEGRRVAIHASKTMPAYARDAAIAFGLDPESLPKGAIVGHVTLAGCMPTREARPRVSEEELWFGDFTDGRYAWFLTHPTEESPPTPARGALGFWEWTPPKQEAHL